jgi:hypothetical protein
MKYLFILLALFTVTTKMPLDDRRVYKNVKAVEISQYFYKLTLSNDKIVYVPVMFTIVEEQ